MLNIIYCELYKLKRSRMLLLIPVGALLPPLLNFFVCLNSMNTAIYSWDKQLSYATMLINLVMAIALFSLLSGYLYSREYSENTVNTMYSYPVSRVKFLLAKLLVSYVLIVVVLALSFGLTIVFGLLLPHDALKLGLLALYCKIFFAMTLMHLALVPAAAFLGVVGKNVIPPVVMGITAVFVNIVIIGSDYSVYFPWSLPGVLSMTTAGISRSTYMFGIGILAAVFILSAAATIIYVVKSDILTHN